MILIYLGSGFFNGQIINMYLHATHQQLSLEERVDYDDNLASIGQGVMEKGSANLNRVLLYR